MTRTTIPLLLLGLLAGVPRAQDPVPESKRKLDEWPKLEDAQAKRIAPILAQFRKEDAKLHEEAHEQLVAMGDAAAPLLMARLTDNRVNFNEPVIAVLDEIVGPRHAALLAREARSRTVVERRYVLKRLATFCDVDMAPVLRAAVKDKDAETAFHAALGLAGLGDLESLETVLEHCRDDWEEDGALIAEVLPHARSVDSGRWILERAGKGKTADKIAALRMARYLAPVELSRLVAVHLDDQQHAVKKEAINALRAIHGQEPMENLSVFQAIEMAKEWKAKL